MSIIPPSTGGALKNIRHRERHGISSDVVGAVRAIGPDRAT